MAHHQRFLLPILLCVGLASSAVSKADIVLGNLPATNDFNSTSFSIVGSKGIGFTMTQTRSLDEVWLRLFSGVSTHSPGVYVMSNVAGNPGSVLTILQNPTMGLGLANYAFTATTPFSLVSGTTYWLVLASNASTNGLVWYGSSPAVVPTGVAATYAGVRFAGASFPPTGPSSVINSFQVLGSPVPEPSMLTMMSFGLAGVAVVALRRRKR